MELENFEPSDIKGRIGARTYKEIFKLLMRLRANAIWPGMHGITTPFYFVPGAKEAADSCGILIGTSHCEPMMRNNVGEWKVNERGDYNYITNREGVQSYWIERLKEADLMKISTPWVCEVFTTVEWKGSRPFRKRPMHCNRLLTTSASYYRSM